MKLVLTRSDNNKEIIVDSDSIKLMEPSGDGSTHLIFGADLGRNVKETLASIANVIGVVSPGPIALSNASEVAAAQLKKPLKR